MVSLSNHSTKGCSQGSHCLCEHHREKRELDPKKMGVKNRKDGKQSLKFFYYRIMLVGKRLVIL